MRSRIMYNEDKSSRLVGPYRIGRVTFSKTGSTLRYDGRQFQSLKGYGYKAKYVDIDGGEQFWICGPRRDGAHRLYGRITQPEDVDPDVAKDDWVHVRGLTRAPSWDPKHMFVSGEAPAPSPSHGRKGRRIANAVLTRAARADLT